MKRIIDEKKLKTYIKKYHLEDYFSEDVSEAMILFHFKQGEFIYSEGDVLSYYYFFVEGKSKVVSTMANGKSLLLSVYEPLQVLGDVEIISDGLITVNVRALSDSYCIGIPADYMRKHVIKDVKFLQMTCSNLGSKLNRCSKNSSINLLYGLEHRLASYILATETQSSNILTSHDSLTEISELLGTSYRHLLRTIKGFMDKGIIKRTDKGYEIVDKKPLQGMIHDLYTTRTAL